MLQGRADISMKKCKYSITYIEKVNNGEEGKKGCQRHNQDPKHTRILGF